MYIIIKMKQKLINKRYYVGGEGEKNKKFIM